MICTPVEEDEEPRWIECSVGVPFHAGCLTGIPEVGRGRRRLIVNAGLGRGRRRTWIRACAVGPSIPVTFFSLTESGNWDHKTHGNSRGTAYWCNSYFLCLFAVSLHSRLNLYILQRSFYLSSSAFPFFPLLRLPNHPPLLLSQSILLAPHIQRSLTCPRSPYTRLDRHSAQLRISNQLASRAISFFADQIRI